MLLSLTNALIAAGLDLNHHGILPFFTHPIIDSFDKSLLACTKPIGKYYETLEELHRLNPECAYGYTANKDYQRLVSSPAPISFIGAGVLKKTIQSHHSIVIVGTGGSVPLLETKNGYESIDAVCDKDFVVAKIATDLNAEKLIILMGVNHVYLDFNSLNPIAMRNVSVNQIQEYISENQFESGSMLPKVQACINFVKNQKNRTAVISDLEHLLEAVALKFGTIIDQE